MRPLLTPLFGEACDSPLHMGTLSCGVLFPPQENARGHSRPRVWKRALPPPPLGNPSRIPNRPHRRFPLPPHWAEMTLDAKQRWILGWRAGLRRVSLGVGSWGMLFSSGLGTRAMRSIGYQPSRWPSSIGPIPEGTYLTRARSVQGQGSCNLD